MKAVLTQLRVAFALTAALTVVAGGAFPLALWGLSQSLLPGQANGSLLARDGRVVGSRLIGQ